jgi:NitT/TauT family transport system permease protein
MGTETIDAGQLRVTIAGLDVLEGGFDERPSLARRAFDATWPKVLAVAIALLAWQSVIWLGIKEPFQLAPPSDAFPELWQMTTDGFIATAIRITMTRAFIGFGLALVIGIAVGMAVASSRILRSGVGSLITGLQTMPSVAWFPLAILLFGIEENAIRFVIVLGAAPSIANGLIAGIDQVPPILLRAGRVLGATGISKWRHVVLPASLPSFLAGLKQGWAFSWRSLMAGELLVTIPGQASVGFLLAQARDLHQSERLLAMMVVVLVIGIVVDALLFGTAERWVRRRWGLLAT